MSGIELSKEAWQIFLKACAEYEQVLSHKDDPAQDFEKSFKNLPIDKLGKHVTVRRPPRYMNLFKE